ncbi:MAG: hypothetical protein AABZ74_01630 [Cyanobacteriota bacterium]
MKDIICPKCNKVQKIGNLNICSYCYYNFSQDKIDERAKLKKDLTPVENKLSDNNILSNLNFKNFFQKDNKLKTGFEKIYKRVFFINFGLFFSISLILFFVDFKLFPIFISGSFFVILSLILSFITTYFFYNYLDKFFYLEDIASSIFYKTRSGRETTKFEQIFSLSLILYFINFGFDYLAIYSINDFSSIIIPSKTYNVFIYKEMQPTKGGYNYYINVTNWKKTTDTYIKLKTNQNTFDKYKDQKSGKIKVKGGIFESVIWKLEQ